MSLLWHPLAVEDRERIMDHVALQNPSAALRLDEAFEAHAHKAVQEPQLYKPGRVPGTREIVVHPNYLMVYRVEDGKVTVLRVLHAAQMWPVKNDVMPTGG